MRKRAESPGRAKVTADDAIEWLRHHAKRRGVWLGGRLYFGGHADRSRPDLRAIISRLSLWNA
jgi:hypothetical protein